MGALTQQDVLVRRRILGNMGVLAGSILSAEMG